MWLAFRTVIRVVLLFNFLKKTMLLVSVIIPVYNVDKYLRQCVDSILYQSYRSIEVILVDDGSPDSSPLICDEYAKMDKRVKVIHKQNGGLSDARNVGLMSATGDYVVFLDSDDFWMDDKKLEVLVDEVEKTPDCDFIGFNCSYYYEEEDKYSPWISYQRLLYQDDKNGLILSLIKTGIFPISACSKIIKKEFLIQNHILFIKGLLSEDIPWFLQLLDVAQKFRMVDLYVYAYRQVSNGLSISHSFKEKHFEDIFWIIKFGIDYIKHSSFTFETQKALLSFMAYEYCILWGSLYKFSNKEYRKSKRKELKVYAWLLQYTEHPKVKKSAYIYTIGGTYLLELALTIYMKSKF